VTPELKLETAKFDRVLKEWQAGTTRSLSVAMNARMSFLLMRVFVLIPPQRVDALRAKIKAYLNQPIGEVRKDRTTGKKVGTGRILRRVHLIAQARRAKMATEGDGPKGLYGERMAKAAASLRRRSIGSVGYLKSGLIQAIKRFNGKYGFTQFGGVTKKSGGKQIQPNGAFLKLMAQYGYVGVLGNVAKHKGVKVQTWPSVESFSAKKLSAAVQLSIGLKDDQVGKVSGMYDAAMTRALRDERAEMEKVIADRLAAAAETAINANR